MRLLPSELSTKANRQLVGIASTVLKAGLQTAASYSTPTSKVAAAMGALSAFFANVDSELSAALAPIFHAVVELETGMKVEVNGKPTVHIEGGLPPLPPERK